MMRIPSSSPPNRQVNKTGFETIAVVNATRYVQVAAEEDGRSTKSSVVSVASIDMLGKIKSGSYPVKSRLEDECFHSVLSSPSFLFFH